MVVSGFCILVHCVTVRSDIVNQEGTGLMGGEHIM